MNNAFYPSITVWKFVSRSSEDNFTTHVDICHACIQFLADYMKFS